MRSSASSQKIQSPLACWMASLRAAAAKLSHQGKSKNSGAEAGGDLPGPIRRAGVHDHHFVHQVGHRLQAVGQVGLLVLDDHGQRQRGMVGPRWVHDYFISCISLRHAGGKQQPVAGRADENSSRTRDACADLILGVGTHVVAGASRCRNGRSFQGKCVVSQGLKRAGTTQRLVSFAVKTPLPTHFIVSTHPPFAARTPRFVAAVPSRKAFLLQAPYVREKGQGSIP